MNRKNGIQRHKSEKQILNRRSSVDEIGLQNEYTIDCLVRCEM